jgi:hypothetical protein
MPRPSPWRGNRPPMRKTFTVLSGTGIRVRREFASSATEALRLFREFTQFRRLNIRIEDERGNPVTFFQLKALTESESRENGSRT